MDWSYRYTPYIWSLLATTAFLWALGLYAWRRRNVPGAIYFALLMFLGGILTLCSALELLSVDLTTKVFWWKLEVMAQLPAITAMFCFVVAYAGLGRWLTRRNLAVADLVRVIRQQAEEEN